MEGDSSALFDSYDVYKTLRFIAEFLPLSLELNGEVYCYGAEDRKVIESSP